ncbi:MAG: hypothetical protein ACREOY_14105 [Candidatus Dormibacteraceae bacterium]
MARYLLVLHELDDSPALVVTATELSAADPSAKFVLLVPAVAPPLDLLLEPSGSAVKVARRRAQRMRGELLAAGINLIACRLGNYDPFRAVEDATRFTDYSVVVVAAPPHKMLHFLHSDLPCRVARRFRPLRVIHAGGESSTPFLGLTREQAARSAQH